MRPPRAVASSSGLSTSMVIRRRSRSLHAGRTRRLEHLGRVTVRRARRKRRTSTRAVTTLVTSRTMTSASTRPTLRDELRGRCRVHRSITVAWPGTTPARSRGSTPVRGRPAAPTRSPACSGRTRSAGSPPRRSGRATGPRVRRRAPIARARVARPRSRRSPTPTIVAPTRPSSADTAFTSRSGILELEPVNRFAHPRAGPLERRRHNDRREVAEIGADARHRLVELLVRVALSRGVVRRRHRHDTIGHRPAESTLPQRGANTVLGGGDERRRQVAAFDAGRELDAVPDRCRVDPQPDRRQVRVPADVNLVERAAGADDALDADVRVPRNRAGTPNRCSSSAPMTSFCTSPCRLSAQSSSSSRRSMSGSSSASSVSAANSAPRCAASTGSTTRLQRRRRERTHRARGVVPMVSPTRHPTGRARRRCRPAARPASSRSPTRPADAERRHPFRLLRRHGDPVTDPQLAAPHA